LCLLKLDVRSGLNVSQGCPVLARSLGKRSVTASQPDGSLNYSGGTTECRNPPLSSAARQFRHGELDLQTSGAQLLDDPAGLVLAGAGRRNT
jgi:hypothetical protein